MICINISKIENFLVKNNDLNLDKLWKFLKSRPFCLSFFKKLEKAKSKAVCIFLTGLTELRNVFQLYILLLLQDPHAEEFEDKEWTFVIENVS